MTYGLVRVAAAVPRVEVANVDYNLAQIEKQVEEACRMNVQAVVFPELCITGYSCQDLFAQRLLIDEAEKAVVRLMEFTRGRDIAVIVGVPVDTGKLLLNCAAVVACGRLCTLVPKTYLPNYGEFYEKRWFASLQRYGSPRSPCSSPFRAVPTSALRYARTYGHPFRRATTLLWLGQTSCSISLPATN